MNSEQLNKVKSFGISNTENKTRYTFAEALSALGKATDDCINAFDLSCKNTDDLLSKFLIDASIKNFENFIEAFRDIITMYYVLTEHKPLNSLLDCIKTFSREERCNNEGMQMLQFLYARNKLVHQYYNQEFLVEQFITAMTNYSDGLQDICKSVFELVKVHNLLDMEIKK